jgi:hypothetical protein
MLFLDRRVHFLTPEGVEQDANSGAPVVLVAFGDHEARRLERCGLGGAFLSSWRVLVNQTYGIAA